MEETKKKFYKRWWFWVLIVIVFFIVVGSIDNTPTPTKVGSVTDTTKEQPVSQKQVFKIGDQIQSGDSYLTVTKVIKDWKSTNQFDKPSSSSDVYVLVTIAIENKGDSNLSLSGMWDFKLEDANGVQKTQALGGIGIKQLPTGELSPGGKATGDILFDVDKSALSNLKLHYEPLFSLNKEIVVELQ